MQKTSEKRLPTAEYFNKVVSSYSIISGLLGVIAILSSFGEGFLTQPAQIIAMDVLFIFLYLLLLQRGVVNWKRVKLDGILKYFLVAQSFSITLFGIVYVFSGIIDSYFYLLFNDSFQYGFELTTGGRYSLYYDLAESDRTLFGINLIPLILLVGNKFYEK